MNWFDFEFDFKKNNRPLIANYMYAVGGYYSIDNGCPAWGTANPADIRVIGDNMGSLKISYIDGTSDIIPLVFGYTLWFYNNWHDGGAPFKTEEMIPRTCKLLKDALYLYGGFEGNKKCVLKIKLSSKAISCIELKNNPKKNGTPVFDGFYLTSDNDEHTILSGGSIDVDTSADFFKYRIIDSSNDPYPMHVKKALDKINFELMTYDDDYQNAEPFIYPEGYDGTMVMFNGTAIAGYIGGVFYHNALNLEGRVGEDGLFHESYLNAPSWRYDGFGTWVPKANSYYTAFYTRNRSLTTLAALGKATDAEKSVNYANRLMMYYPDENLKIKGKDIPGHYSVIVNEPLIYSKVLVNCGWPTKYTQEAFGEDYQNLGNQETDGHGIMMISNFVIWKALGSKAEWVNNNWTYINEGAKWIIWCFDNPDISFAQDNLLYSETEGGMCDYTLYCNVPCYLGLVGYSKMAEATGKSDIADLWLKYAERLKSGIDRLIIENKWNEKKFGFNHDPVLSYMMDVFGFDINDMLPEWVELSKQTYSDDLIRIARQGYFGPAGIGYDHCIFTENSLLLDQMDHVDKLINNLSKICYAPRLPEPYLVPEGITVDVERKFIRRQGDLANNYQLAETLRTYLLVMGVSPVSRRILKIMPRLPKNWNLNIEKLPVQNSDSNIYLTVNYPLGGVQTASFCLDSVSDIDLVKLRFGPFKTEANSGHVMLNGKMLSAQLIDSGDSKWIWLDLAPETDVIYNMEAIVR